MIDEKPEVKKNQIFIDTVKKPNVWHSKRDGKGTLVITYDEIKKMDLKAKDVYVIIQNLEDKPTTFLWSCVRSRLIGTVW